MNERNNKLELLGSAPIPKALMALGIPIMIGMLINALYNLVDAYFVSGLGKSQMGAISVVFPLGQVVVGLGLMFGNGAASYLSRLLGRGDKDTADKVASTALYSSILIGAIIILLSAIFLKPILVMLGATETIMPYALTYARIYVLSCVFNVFNVTMNNTYEECVQMVGQMKDSFETDVFGVEKEDGKVQGIIAAVYQSVFGQDAYPSLEEKAANLLYFMIKDHPYADGCKRIAASLFLEFLDKNNALFLDGEKRLSDGTLVAITLMIAESKSEEKDVMVKLVMNLLKL